MIIKRNLLGRRISITDSMRHAFIAWNWRFDRLGLLHVPGAKLSLTTYFFDVMYSEWRTWQKHYLPPFSLKGKSVLDVGAACGESAYFFFRSGASHVIAVESDPTLIPYLELNMKTNNWNMEIIARPFDITMLSPRIDWMKMDIEGGESVLRNVNEIPPCIIEVHDADSLEMLLSRFGLQLLTPRNAKLWLVAGHNQSTRKLTL